MVLGPTDPGTLAALGALILCALGSDAKAQGDLGVPQPLSAQPHHLQLALGGSRRVSYGVYEAMPTLPVPALLGILGVLDSGGFADRVGDGVHVGRRDVEKFLDAGVAPPPCQFREDFFLAISEMGG